MLSTSSAGVLCGLPGAAVRPVLSAGRPHAATGCRKCHAGSLCWAHLQGAEPLVSSLCVCCLWLAIMRSGALPAGWHPWRAVCHQSLRSFRHRRLPCSCCLGPAESVPAPAYAHSGPSRCSSPSTPTCCACRLPSSAWRPATLGGEAPPLGSSQLQHHQQVRQLSKKLALQPTMHGDVA